MGGRSRRPHKVRYRSILQAHPPFCWRVCTVDETTVVNGRPRSVATRQHCSSKDQTRPSSRFHLLRQEGAIMSDHDEAVQGERFKTEDNYKAKMPSASKSSTAATAGD